MKSVEDAAAASEVIVVCVLDYAVSESLLTPAAVAEKLRGKTLVQLTSGTPPLAREAEAWAQNNSISYLDGAIISYPSGVGTPDCTILYAGQRQVFEAHKQLLGCHAGNSMFLGESIGSASALDSSLLTFGFTAELGFLHGAALCEAEGIPIDSYRQAANALMPILAADMLKAAAMIPKANYAGEVSLQVAASAFGNILRFSDEAGVDRAGSESLVTLVKRAIDAGYGGDEFPAVFEVLRTRKRLDRIDGLDRRDQLSDHEELPLGPQRQQRVRSLFIDQLFGHLFSFLRVPSLNQIEC
ncbi:MAG: NAD(P)-dependent oxidoreductase [Deltaproteobacteria bacterium]|nr:NAD(P)-dependent oxidoreductase [Deltaproteobacteria bacterium]